MENIVFYQQLKYIFNERHIVFRGRNLVYLPLPGKAIKLSFSSSPQTLSPTFDSAPVYREAELSASVETLWPGNLLRSLAVHAKPCCLYVCN